MRIKDLPQAFRIDEDGALIGIGICAFIIWLAWVLSKMVDAGAFGDDNAGKDDHIGPGNFHGHDDVDVDGDGLDQISPQRAQQFLNDARGIKLDRQSIPKAKKILAKYQDIAAKALPKWKRQRKKPFTS